MSRIKGKDTNLEKSFRKSISAVGIKGYRLYAKVEGKPDLYFPGKKTAVFIDGCFWHGCSHCGSFPRTNVEFWKKKIEANKKRDRIINIKLEKSGFRVVRFREHDIIKNPEKCVERLQDALQKSTRKSPV